MAKKCEYPFHLGITATGLPPAGIIKSALGIGSLLLKGIGDTIRVSLTGPSREEVRAGQEILRALGLRKKGPEIIACPTCGRTRSNGVAELAGRIEARFGHISAPVTVAIMGCEVNGPGEAMQADVGVAFSKERAVLFRQGMRVGTLKDSEIERVLSQEIDALAKTPVSGRSADGTE